MPDHPNPSDHLPNERTLLAWIRTGIGIMAFGFVVVKFSLFVRELGLALCKPVSVSPSGLSAPIGIMLVAVGALSLFLSLLRYHKTKKQLDTGTYYQSSVVLYVLVGFILLVSILLIAYLVKTT
jgi:putative membrane protein